jgi:hypothetical protein
LLIVGGLPRGAFVVGCTLCSFLHEGRSLENGFWLGVTVAVVFVAGLVDVALRGVMVISLFDFKGKTLLTLGGNFIPEPAIISLSSFFS